MQHFTRIQLTRPVAKGGGKGGRAPPAKPECPLLEQKILHFILRYCKKVKFRANVLNFACVSVSQQR